MVSITRRGLLAGAAVVGFDLAGRRWVTAPGAQAAGRFDEVPALDGRLAIDSATRDEHAVDRGRIIDRRPEAVLFPGSVADVQRMVAFCAARAINVAARGQAHSTHGQALSDGLAINMQSLRTVHEMRGDRVVVDAGITWHDLVEATVARGLTPPVTTGYTRLTLGGTLSMGGVSSNNRHGLLIDNVLELEVVDGTGTLLTCSQTKHRRLYEAVLGGVGQFGVIVRATIPLSAAPDKVRQWRFFHVANDKHFRDTRTLVHRGELEEVYTEWTPGTTGPLRQFSPAKYYDRGDVPSTAHYMRGLTQPWPAYVPQDYDYIDYLFRVDAQIDVIQTLGWDALVKPWFDVFLPESTIEQFVSEMVEPLRPEVIGQGFVLVFTHRRSKARNPMYRLPREDGSDFYYLFDILPTSLLPGPDAAFAAAWIERNRRMYERARELGGTRYAIGALKFTTADWAAEYGDRWPTMIARKRRFDPAGILGQGIDMFAGT